MDDKTEGRKGNKNLKNCKKNSINNNNMNDSNNDHDWMFPSLFRSDGKIYEKKSLFWIYMLISKCSTSHTKKQNGQNLRNKEPN